MAGSADMLAATIIIVLAATRLALATSYYTPMNPAYEIRIQQGISLDDDSVSLAKLQPASSDASAAHLNISFVEGRIVLETGEGTFAYHGYMYKDNKDDSVNTYGPTMRFTPPSYPTLMLYNEVILPTAPVPSNGPEDEWGLTTYTNMHQHGLWAYHGVTQISNPEPYHGGDNVFRVISPKANASSDPPYNFYNYTVGPYHLPGNLWYHPHHHQATALQSQTAAGNTIVDGDNTFLTAENNCSQILEILLAAKERVIMLQTLFFTPSDGVFSPLADGYLQQVYQDPGYQQIAELSVPQDPVCCNESRSGYEFNMTSKDFMLLNGFYQPTITIQAGVYQRWRILEASWKKYHDMAILNMNDDELAPCDLQLISKDSIYLMEIPRSIFHFGLASAQRAEVLITCFGEVGTKYRLAAGVYPSFGPDFAYDEDSSWIVEPHVATIEITDPIGADAVLKTDLNDFQRSCKPLRPSYVADLRDEVLADRGLNPLRQNVFLANEVAKGGCVINGRNWSFPANAQNSPMSLQLGKVVEIQYEGSSFHPIHLHESPQQLVFLPSYGFWDDSLNVTLTSFYEIGDWHDTVFLPNIWDATQLLLDGGLVVRMQPGPFGGYSVIHCHFLMHEDRGCMKIVQWRCPNTNPGVDGEIPYPCKGGFQFPVSGDFVEEELLYNGIPTFLAAPPNPFTSAPSLAPDPALNRSANAGANVSAVSG